MKSNLNLNWATVWAVLALSWGVFGQSSAQAAIPGKAPLSDADILCTDGGLWIGMYLDPVRQVRAYINAEDIPMTHNGVIFGHQQYIYANAKYMELGWDQLVVTEKKHDFVTYNPNSGPHNEDLALSFDFNGRYMALNGTLLLPVYRRGGHPDRVDFLGFAPPVHLNPGRFHCRARSR